MNKTKRIECFDVAKGISILLVICGHTISAYFKGTFINKWIYSFHMPLFFILSGYFYKAASDRGTIQKKIKHLLLPYLVINASKCIFELVINGFHYSTLQECFVRTLYGSGSNAKANLCLFPVPIVGMTWFLLALLCCQILYICLDELAKYFRIPTFVLVIVVALVGMELNDKVWLPFSLQPAMGALIFYHAGRCMKEKKYLENDLKDVPMGGILFGFVLWMMTIKYESIGMHANSYTGLGTIISAIFGTFIIVQLSKNISRIPIIGKFLRLCGINSMLIYGFHALDVYCLTSLKSMVLSIFTLPSKKGVLLMCILRIVLVLICTIFFLFIENIFINTQRRFLRNK